MKKLICISLLSLFLGMFFSSCGSEIKESTAHLGAMDQNTQRLADRADSYEKLITDLNLQLTRIADNMEGFYKLTQSDEIKELVTLIVKLLKEDLPKTNQRFADLTGNAKELVDMIRPLVAAGTDLSEIIRIVKEKLKEGQVPDKIEEPNKDPVKESDQGESDKSDKTDAEKKAECDRMMKAQFYGKTDKEEIIKDIQTLLEKLKNPDNNSGQLTEECVKSWALENDYLPPEKKEDVKK